VKWNGLGVVFGAAAALGACSQPPYSAEDGRTDLIDAGFSETAAGCVIDGIDAYFREEFLQKQAAEGIAGVPKAQVDNYVKNRFAGISDIPEDLAEETHRLAAECR
jgi:hypothetical protein